MKIQIFLLCTLVALVAAQTQVCYNLRILSRHATPNDPDYGSFDWNAGGDYSGTHGGPGSTGSITGFHFDGIKGSLFRGVVVNNQLAFLDDGLTDYEFNSAGRDFTFKQTSLINLIPRGSSAGTALDLNKATVQNDFGLDGTIDFTITRTLDGAQYSGTLNFDNQLFTGDFNGAGFGTNTFTVWLWGEELAGGTGHSFLTGDGLSKPLALDVILSGEVTPCDGTGGGKDCTIEETCDPELCNNGADCECTLHAQSADCATLCIDFGSGGSCDITIP